MNNTKIVDKDFKVLRDICHKNPVEYMQKSQDYRQIYEGLSENHFLFIDAYAYTKIGRYELAEPLLKEILTKAISDNNHFFLVHANLLLSLCFRNDLKQEKLYLDTAEKNARQAEDSLLLAAVLAYRGDSYFRLNNFALAEDFHKQVQEILANQGESQIKLQSLLSLANIYISDKQLDKALNYLYMGMEISKREDNQQFTLLLDTSLAKVLQDLKRFPEAEKHLLEANTLSINLGLMIQRIQVVFNLAVLKIKSNSFTEAISYLDTCRQLAQENAFNMPEFLLDLYNNYAIAYALKGDFNKAISDMDKAVKIASEIGDIVAEQEIYLNLGKMLMDTGEYDRAEILFLRSLKASKKYKLKEHFRHAREKLVQLYDSKQDYHKCFNLMQKIQDDLLKDINKLKKQENSHEITNLDFNKFNKTPSSNNLLTRGDFVGVSQASRKILQTALLLAKEPNANVLLRGESGTGKDLIANFIHNASPRKDYPFIPINAAAISSSLMESELFGHKKGSYTGAISDEKGLFLKAHKGTLFIDEISEIPVGFQAKLLRVLESRKVIPVGSCNEVSFDARIISSSNRDIIDLVNNDLFRLDLLYRINTIEIVIPPLRDRKEDIPLLVDHFINIFCNEHKKLAPEIHSSLISYLQDYNFPGNVRELKNIIEKMFILGQSNYWDAQLLDEICSLDITRNDLTSSDYEAEKEKITRALIRFKGIRRDAAKFLKMSNSTMTRRIEKYNLQAYTSIKQKKK